jgi:hypothetical protein
MSIQVALNHWTRYRYDKPVSIGPQIIRLRPAPHCRTPILSYSLTVTPPGHVLNWLFDAHNNHLARLLFPDKTNEFSVEVDLFAELSPFNPFNFILEPGAADYPFDYAPELAKDLEPYLSADPAGPLLRDLPWETFPRDARNDRLFGRRESQNAKRNWLRHAPGSGRPDMRADPSRAHGILP